MSALWKWEKPYLRAFMETNPLNLPRRIADVERAIFLRTTELQTRSDRELEWQAIESAKSGLSILKKEIELQNGINALLRLPISNS
jgi:hypothetical protein